SITEERKEWEKDMAIPEGLLPVLPLRNMVVFPGLTHVIRVGREKSMHALKKAESMGYWIVTAQQKIDGNEIAPDNIYPVATVCRIDSMKGSEESGYQVVVRGFHRVHLDQISVEPQLNFIQANVTKLDEVADMNEATRKSLLDSLKQMALDVLKLVPANTENLAELIKGVDDLSYLTSLCGGNLEIEAQEKQKILAMNSLRDRSLHLLSLMKKFKEGLEVQSEIRAKLNQKLGAQQRQSILREHLKAIREELGEKDDESFEEKILRRLAEVQAPDEIRKLIEGELRRFSELGTQSPESHIIRNYVELLSSLPWGRSSPETEIDLQEARRVLDEDHYGLESVKKRIIQQLAVMKLKKDLQGSILLFVGPPGVGKTSLGQSIARALGRKFVRVSVGGVRDDAEIRGHRRTYIGALPGRIIQGLKRAGENNPVFLLDEIDKLARGFHGDPAAALLEVLDPEQNRSFLDHYLDIGFDLSKVLFICTANQIESIPGPLLDRMEVVELSGYTMAEKLHIAKSHLIPKVMDSQGFTAGSVQISDEALSRMIGSYTREAGVREFQRQITSVLRGVSEQVVDAIEKKTSVGREDATGGELPLRVESKDLLDLLGPEKFFQEVTESINPPGVVTGLAWTPVGGDILFLESTAMPGRGELILTGQLGDVMKESAKIALSLIRSHWPDLGLSLDLKRHDLHLHVPAGAIPKDGPSAGVAIFTSMVSLLTRRSVSAKLAMTGEITLRGAITPVGGIKEKVIAAQRAGVTDVILPEKNRRNLQEIPKDIQSQLRIHFVSRVEELLKIVFGIEIHDLGPQLLLDGSNHQPNSDSGKSEI
ncbi:MAG: endopeptidase La, partial [Bdellovibrio sp.]